MPKYLISPSHPDELTVGQVFELRNDAHARAETLHQANRFDLTFYVYHVQELDHIAPGGETAQPKSPKAAHAQPTKDTEQSP